MSFHNPNPSVRNSIGEFDWANFIRSKASPSRSLKVRGTNGSKSQGRAECGHEDRLLPIKDPRNELSLVMHEICRNGEKNPRIPEVGCRGGEEVKLMIVLGFPDAETEADLGTTWKYQQF